MDIERLIVTATDSYRAGRTKEAEAICRRIITSASEYSRAHILLGLCLARFGLVKEAIASLSRGVELDPQSFDGVVGLCNMYRLAANLDEAKRYGKLAVSLKPNDPAGYAARGLCCLAAGDPTEAADLFTKALSLDSSSAPLNHNLGRALQLSGNENAAVEAYRRAVKLEPNRPESHINLGQILYEMGDRTGANSCFRRAYKLEPDTARGLVQLAKAQIDEGDIDDANETLTRAIAMDPNMASAFSLIGNVLQQTGDFEGAASKLETAIKLQPGFPRPYFDLVSCRTVVESDRPLMAQMERLLEDRRLVPDDMRHLHYGLGKAYRNLGNLAEAMGHYDRANEIMLSLCRTPFDRAAHSAMIDATIKSSPSFVASQTTGKSTSPSPVLVVGMIRSGTTLVEQIVSSHPEIEAGGELTFWQEKAHLATGRQGGIDLERLGGLANEYLGVLREISPTKPYVTDKMPLNFFHLGLILRAFSCARIVHCRRDPPDTCLSIYVTPFPSPVNFAHRKDNIVFFYREYLRLMSHWREVLPPDRFLEVDYERIVANKEGETKRLIEFLGLEWDDRCLRPGENRRVVRTPSLWQVRQPIYGSSIGRWHEYAQWLGPILEFTTESKT